MKIVLLRQKADYLGINGLVLCIIHSFVMSVLVMTSNSLNHGTIRVGFLSLDYRLNTVTIVAVWPASRHTSRRLAVALWSFLTYSLRGYCSKTFIKDLNTSLTWFRWACSLPTHLVNIRDCRTYHIY